MASDFLVTAVCVLVALRFIRHQFAALGTAAVVCTAIMLPIYQSAQGAWFSFFWTFMFLAGLVMGLRWVRPVWLALGVGAALGGMVGRLLPVPESARVIETLLAALAKGALFAAVLWFGLRLAGTREQKLSKGFFVGSWGCGLALSVLGTYLFLKPAHGRPDLSVGLVALIPMLYAAGAMLILIHQMWAAIQDGKARTTPGKAVGLLFVPFFNLYWAFEAYWGFAKDYNAYVQRRSVNARRLPEGLFLAYPILALVSVIPIVFPVTFVVGLIVVWKICDAVNALEAPEAGAVPLPSVAIKVAAPPEGRLLVKRTVVVLASLFVVLCVVLGGLLLAAHRSGGPFRVVLFDAGNGQGAMDIEKLSNVTITFTFDGGIRPQPVWEQRDADVVVEHDLEFNNRKWRAGERLTSDGERLVPQSLRRRLWNDVRYAVWRFEQPNHGKREQLWIRARAVGLRGQAGEGTGPERGQVKFGDRVEVLERGADDWMNVADLSTRRRGWIHSVVTTGDASQIERLRREDSAPALILRMEARSAQEINGLTVAGFLVADANRETQPQVNDCVMFGAASLQHFPKPTRIHGLTIDEPHADKLYCVDSSHGLKVRDVASLL
jgi:hypothetical protein